MKNKLIWLVLILAVCGGCGKTKPDKTEARIADLEHEIVLLGSAQQAESKNVAALIGCVSELNTNIMSFSNYFDLLRDAMFIGLAKNSLAIDDLSNNMARITVKPAQYSSRPVSAPAVQKTKDGIPIDVYNGILAYARKEYPTDFHMQAFVIKDQTEAWIKINGKR